jgi:predicted transcriptional regulator of viral defense system
MDWLDIVSREGKISPILRITQLAEKYEASEHTVRAALVRLAKRGLVEHIGKKIFVAKVVSDFSGREIASVLRPQSYLSLDSVLRDAGISTQVPSILTFVTTGREARLRASIFRAEFRRISIALFWGYEVKETKYGRYNVAEPEKALLDWIYLRRKRRLETPFDELNLSSLDRPKLLKYAERFPKPTKQTLLEGLATYLSTEIYR